MVPVTPAEIALQNFIVRTDRKSLYTQIKALVTKAEQVAEDELNVRRQKIKKLLEDEDSVYEQEFANKVKSRMDEDIKARKDILMKTRDAAALIAAEFLEKKKIQQNIQNCHEIRDAIRLREIRNTKEIQLEQIVERERRVAREREQDKLWMEIERNHWDRDDQKQRSEDNLKENIQLQTKKILDKQLEELNRKREMEREEKVKDAKIIKATIDEIRLEEQNIRFGPLYQKKAQYRNDLIEMMKRKRERNQAEVEQAKEEKLRIMNELKQIEDRENAEAIARKRALHKATIDYIQYVRRIRYLENEHEMMRDACIDNVRRVELCTKANIKKESERKAKIAAQCYKELKEQICYQLARRWHEENERRHYKETENPFARKEPTRAEILAQRQKNREELDKQVIILNQIRAEQEAQYERELKSAAFDEKACKELAEKYMTEGIDYLPTHANWNFLQTCLGKNNVKLLSVPPRKSIAVQSDKQLGRKYTPQSCTAECYVDPFRLVKEKYMQFGQGDSCILPCADKTKRQI